MRRVSLIVIICLAVLPTIAFSQDSPIGKGSLMASGGFSYTNYIDDDYSVINLNPSLTYFISPGLALGMALTFSRQSNGSTYSAYGIGPSFKYYIDVEKKREQIRGTVYPYIGFEFLTLKEKYNSYYGYDDTRSTNVLYFQLGAMTMIADNAGFYTELEYERRKVEDYDSQDAIRFHGGFSYFIY